ncbi:MAG: hypothetical protein LBK56_12260 [Gracilibacteraceae bacterium]|nr:hypothetical protein [Gracilibacteraceae bacterium]
MGDTACSIIQYGEMPLTFDIDFGDKLTNDGHSYDEIALTGICCDPRAMRYYISWAKDVSTNKEYGSDSTNEYMHPFQVNRMGISVFDKTGAFLDSVTLPESCLSPYSRNYLTLTQTAPRISGDKMIVQYVNCRREWRLFDFRFRDNPEIGYIC